jgi:hypothetical protein
MSGDSEACEVLQKFSTQKQQFIICFDLYTSGEAGLENRSLRGERTIQQDIACSRIMPRNATFTRVSSRFFTV